MLELRPFLYVPRSNAVARMLEAEPLASSLRARHVGVVVVAPRTIRPADLMAASQVWHRPLHDARVRRIAVLLGIESYVAARPLFAACRTKLAEHAIAAEYFHEAHLESDQIRAWFAGTRPQRRVTTDVLVRLSQRYALRGDARAASQALRIAETMTS